MRELYAEDIYKGSHCEYCGEKIFYNDDDDRWYASNERCGYSPSGYHKER